MLVALEPPVLIVLWFIDRPRDGHLLGIALWRALHLAPVAGDLRAAVIWDAAVRAARPCPACPRRSPAPAPRISAIALVVSTVVLGAVLALLLGEWALVALPPLALSLASAWLMARAA